MHFPALDDTIVAVASGWSAAPVGIIRLSGPRAIALVASITSPALGGTAGFQTVRLTIDAALQVPATAYVFLAPRSYTGQDVVELHTIGSLPALREATSGLIAAGARRALPGEFTARAFRSGKLDAQQVDGVFALVHAGGADAARQAARLAGGASRRARDAVSHRLLDLIARIEAGIDFVDEEDVRFITANEVRSEIERLAVQLAGAVPGRFDQRRGKPHVALAGLPNAGKSSLFNALLGRERAIVSPVIGTTRDVLAAEIEADGLEIVLQDCAGLGATTDELELAAHVAAESACDQADLVVWVHDAGTEWSDNERRALDRIAFERRILVLSKIDASPYGSPAGPRFSAALPVSIVNLSGLSDVIQCVAEMLRAVAGRESPMALEACGTEAITGLRRAIGALGSADLIAQPEMVSFELRTAASALSDTGPESTLDEILGRIFSQFCIGK